MEESRQKPELTLRARDVRAINAEAARQLLHPCQAIGRHTAQLLELLPRVSDLSPVRVAQLAIQLDRIDAALLHLCDTLADRLS